MAEVIAAVLDFLLEVWLTMWGTPEARRREKMAQRRARRSERARRRQEEAASRRP